jgi:putative membrane protein
VAVAFVDPETGSADRAPRRTHLAAERTWLAWWRTGLATATAALAVGRLAPELVGGSTWPYVALGAGYAVLAVALLLLARERERRMRAALNEDSYEELSPAWVTALTVAAVVLALGTLLLIVAEG